MITRRSILRFHPINSFFFHIFVRKCDRNSSIFKISSFLRLFVRTFLVFALMLPFVTGVYLHIFFVRFVWSFWNSRFWRYNWFYRFCTQHRFIANFRCLRKHWLVVFIIFVFVFFTWTICIFFILDHLSHYIHKDIHS